jgi:phosphopantothenoylcysteine decarboxylase/phosphopantothenate--cysteine ligase
VATMLTWKNKRRVVLGITGGIAAYKGPEILRALQRAGCEVEVVLTEGAESFVSPMVLSTLAGRRTWTQDDFLSQEKGWEIPHINLADWAELVIIAPCTAETLARLVQGRGESLLDATVLATKAPVLLFPAMNSHMLEHPATVRNIKEARAMSYTVVDPDEGSLACGYEGKGRLPAPSVIVEEAWRALSPRKDFAGVSVLVTAGPTWEFIDPVRFISNPSSGKMGFALARTAWYRGADVTLVSGPVSLPTPHGITYCPVKSAMDMYKAVIEKMDFAKIIIKSAAVSDYRAASIEMEKMKREGKDTLTLNLVQNPDIAAEVGARKSPDQILVGFAAESSHLVEHAKEKMLRKNLDLIVANDITATDAGFAVDTNRVKIIKKAGDWHELVGTKEEVAWGVLNTVSEMCQKEENR